MDRAHPATIVYKIGKSKAILQSLDLDQKYELITVESKRGKWLAKVFIHSSERFLALEEVLKCLEKVLKWLEEVLEWLEEVLDMDIVMEIDWIFNKIYFNYKYQQYLSLIHI